LLATIYNTQLAILGVIVKRQFVSFLNRLLSSSFAGMSISKNDRKRPIVTILSSGLREDFRAAPLRRKQRNNER
jgi:hypothetical protein